MQSILPKLALLFGFLLNIVGAFGFFGTGATHYTALIPSLLGILLIMSGVVAHSEAARRHAMHAAVLVALFGFLGTASSLGSIVPLLEGSTEIRAAAVTAKIATAILCGLFFALCLQSFIQTQRAKKKNNRS